MTRQPNAVAYACPIHKVVLEHHLYCSQCDIAYPTVNGVPVLLNEGNSIFRVADYVDGAGYGGASAYAGHLDNRKGLMRLYRSTLIKMYGAGPPVRRFSANDAAQKVRAILPGARMLVIGSGDTSVQGDNVTYTDVAFGQNVQCIADAHDLPFPDESFDACFAVAVLEHVLDPYRCVQEIVRVLKPCGYVYAETPFLQPVHMGRHDFTRFTPLGHRRLFRYFDDVESGILGGPGTSLAQLMRYSLVSLSDSTRTKKWLRLLSAFIAYPVRWLDYLSLSKASAYDAASNCYFFGRLRDEPISDFALLDSFRGG